LRGLEHKPCDIQKSRSPGGDYYTFQGAGLPVFVHGPADRNDVEKLKQAGLAVIAIAALTKAFEPPGRSASIHATEHPVKVSTKFIPQQSNNPCHTLPSLRDASVIAEEGYHLTGT
jgi:hypothetical protein